MGRFSEYPYNNFSDLNLDWLLKRMKEISKDFIEFVDINTIKYADPLLWNISKQYEQNTLVQSESGVTFLSKDAVPAGIALENENYWLKVADFEGVSDRIMSNIAANEGVSRTASAPRAVNDLVWLDGYLFKVIAPMISGDSYVVGSNCEPVILDAFINSLRSLISNETTERESADTALGNRIDSEVGQRESSYNALDNKIDTEITNRENALNTEKTERENAIEDLRSELSRIGVERHCLVIGDSYGTGGSQTGHTYTPYPTYAHDYTGVDFYNCSESGAGFAKVGDLGHDFEGLLDELTTSVDKNSITDIYAMGGFNDRTQTDTVIINKILSFINRAKVLYVNAKVHIGFIGWGTGAPDYLILARARMAYIIGANQYGADYMTGIEFVMHDFSYFDSDGIHPNEDGQRAIARGLVQSFHGFAVDTEKPRVDVSVNAAQQGIAFNVPINMSLNNEVLTWGWYDQQVFGGLSLFGSHTLNGTEDFVLGTMSSNKGYGRGYYGMIGTVPCTVVMSNGTAHIGTLYIRIVGGSISIRVIAISNTQFVSGVMNYISIGPALFSTVACQN